MAGKVNFKELQELQKRLQQAQSQVPALMEDIAKDIAKEFLTSVINRTPASNTNELKKDWKCDFNVTRHGNNYVVTIKNENEIASFIEYGHRTENNGFKQGHFMMTITQQEIERRMNSIAQPKVDNFLKGVFK